MNLLAMITQRVNPGLIRDRLMEKFEYVDVQEATREGWFEMLCIQGEGEDARLRLRIRFIWSQVGAGGWLYRVLPGDR